MSLQTDIVFVDAIRSNTDLIAQLPAGDVYNTAIALPDEDADNAPPPYIIVSFDGLNPQDSTKDNRWDSITDVVTIGIVIVAQTRASLADLAIKVRKTIIDYFTAQVQEDGENVGLIPYNYTMQAEAVQYDPLKPCFWQKLVFTCNTDPDYEERRN